MYCLFRLSITSIIFGALFACFSQCSCLVFRNVVVFTGRFVMEESENSTSLKDLEIDFLKEKLSSFFVEGHYCFGYLDGNRAEVDDLLDSFQALNSTCYVLTESHSKEKKHKRFSQAGM